MKMNLLSIFLLSLIFQKSVFASYTNCPNHIFKNVQYSKAYAFLKSLPVKFKSDGCTIELHVCEQATVSEVNADDDIIGDFLLRNQSGREQYVTFIFPKEKSNHIKTEISGDKTWLHYEYEDSNYDSTNGKKQRVELNIVSTPVDAQPVKRIELQSYTSHEHDKLLGLIPMSFWSICEPDPFNH